MPSTFERYAKRLEAHRLVDTGAISFDDLIAAIRVINDAVAAVEGHGFDPTPFGQHDSLAAAIGLDPSVELWVKDESGNVSGSHKARHLFTAALMQHLTPGGEGPFAIASCGNAALGAAVVAKAVSHPLDVFVPTWANKAVTDRIEDLGGRVVRSERKAGVLGDPAHHAMLAAIADGSVAFSCQGSETPTAIDGGRTIAYEMIEELSRHDRGFLGAGAQGATNKVRLDRLFIQVGGGALGTSVVTGLAAMVPGRDLPVVHAVQPVGNHPLVRAWDRLVGELSDSDAPSDNEDRAAAAARIGRLDDEGAGAVAHRLEGQPSRYMEPWDSEPVSYASGILDDVTYDWIPLIDAMVRTGGHPIVATEDELRAAHRLAHERTDIPVCPTGSAGLAGLLSLLDHDAAAIKRGDRIALLFTGHMRPGDPDPLA